jgi:hypothetical protein
MKLNRTACSLALLGILCAGLAMPGRGRATECESYTSDATAEDIYEANNTPATATLLTNDVWKGAGGDPNCGVMFAAADPADEYDYYKIVVPAGNTGINVDLRFKYSLGDMTLRLYGTDGTTPLATAATEFDNEYIEYKTALAAGTYYIRVYSGQAGNNRYQLMAHVVLPVTNYTVTPSVSGGSGGNGTVSPSSAQTVTSGSTVPFTLTPSSGYTASRALDGSCPQGSWTDNTHYTTGAINANCDVVFSFGLTKVVTSSAGTGGTIDVSGAQNVASGDTLDFTVTPDLGYTTTVGGSCPQGSWTDSTHYTTGTIISPCSVSFSFTPTGVTHTVTPSAGTGGSFTPTGAQTVNHNATKAFTVTASSGYVIYTPVGGTCPAGTWASNVYTTGAITADCTVIFGFLATHTVTPSAGTGGSFTPTGAQTVNHNATKAFTVTASSGYTTDATVGGTCTQGSWVGTVYTTGAITADCTVSFTFTSNSTTHTVTPSAGTGGSFTPTGVQTVNHNTTKAFTVIANSGYTTNSTVGGTCPQGSWVSNVYTTGAILADCTVSFSFSTGTKALPAIYKQLLLKKQ